MQNNKGLTLLEVLVATFIFALLMLGVTNIFLSSKRSILHSRSRMTASELVRYFLDPLQMQVRQDSWNTNCLGVGNCTDASIGIDEGLDENYTAIFNSTPNFIANLTKLRINITWNETTP